MPERIDITVYASGAHPDVLTVQDAMRQVLDIFEMIEEAPGVEWKLVTASTNSPFHITGEAISLAPSVDVTVVARAQKQALARDLRALVKGTVPAGPEFKAKNAKRFLSRNTNGVGITEVDIHDDAEPIKLTPSLAQKAIEALEAKPAVIFDTPTAREEVGSIEGTLQDVGTHYNIPAVRIVSRQKGDVWCRLTEPLQTEFQNKTTYADVWQHRRVVVRGRIKYDDDGDIAYVIATDVRRIEAKNVGLDEIKDENFTGGLSIVDYLDRFRDGTLG